VNSSGSTSSSGPTIGERAALRTLAERLAREAGAIALTGRRQTNRTNGRPGGDTKSSLTDMVTEFDRAAEAHIVGQLRLLRPDDAIVGEEGTDDHGTSGYAWHLDPIDGTTNFVYDQPAWSCSVAVAYRGEMQAGAVFAPPMDEMFTAALGAGATRDGLPIAASSETDLGLALLGTGFGYRAETRRQQAEFLTRVITEVRDIRRLGSAALDLCMVACGRLDAYYEVQLNSWDAAAGELIAREAGAITSDFSGNPARPEQMLAAAPGVHRALLDLIRSG
jgi:myo-inositol-1(or 4)-monophosphatase